MTGNYVPLQPRGWQSSVLGWAFNKTLSTTLGRPDLLVYNAGRLNSTTSGPRGGLDLMRHQPTSIAALARTSSAFFAA
jgi:hypothetical protein